MEGEERKGRGKKRSKVETRPSNAGNLPEFLKWNTNVGGKKEEEASAVLSA